jgi:hypothetical protein
MDAAAELRRVIELNKDVKPTAAERLFEQVIGECPEAGLRALDKELAVALESFLKKRRRHLTELLNARLESGRQDPEEAPTPDGEPADEHSDTVTTFAAAEPANGDTNQAPHTVIGGSHPAAERGRQLNYNYNKFREDLGKLSTYHVFRWSTAYREMITEYFDAFHVELRTTDQAPELLRLIKAAMSDHSKEVFRKVYLLYIERSTSDTDDIIIKITAGLQRFLDLVLEFYSGRLSEPNQGRGWIMHRQLCSAMTFGILNGYARTQFHRPGSQVLLTLPQYWAYALPFLSRGEFSELVDALDADDFVAGIQGSVFPLVDALDTFLDSHPELAPLPALSQYNSMLRCLDVSLQTPSGTDGDRLYKIQCHTDAEYVDFDLIEKAAKHAVSAVVAPLRAEVRAELAARHLFSDIVVEADGTAFGRLREVLANIGYRSKPSSPNRLIDFNWAEEFPLENQAKARYKHVYRLSAFRLLQAAERRGGVRLWCSVRRSGKTTACASDLDTTTSGSAFIAQTCESTDYIVDGDIFYKRVVQALRSGDQLSDDFVTRAVAKCLPVFSAKDTKVVLIIDEYETLFGDLQSSVDEREQLQYRVVQPLLNQLVSFSHENLLIFVGQQPNAHHILMDQNQLSPVVEQDLFPLFSHDPALGPSGEFYELLSLVLSSHVELDMNFVTRVYAETSGHPFLTVKLLISFMNWLIEAGKPISCLAPLRPELFDQFTGSNLDLITILNDENYEFFRGVATEHLSPRGRRKNPWLYSTYSALRAIALFSPDSLELSLDDYTTLVTPDCVETTPRKLLSTATRANFLTFTDGMVRPRIPLLARIASAVTPI